MPTSIENLGGEQGDTPIVLNNDGVPVNTGNGGF